MEIERTAIESLCMNCGKNVMAVLYNLGFNAIITLDDSTFQELSRQVVRSQYATISIPELQLEIPSTNTTRGTLTTVEGLVARIIDDLDMNQTERASEHASIIQEVIGSLQAMRGGLEDFTLAIDDPSGNSYIELSSPEEILPMPSAINRSFMLDNSLSLKKYVRSEEQNAVLNLFTSTSDQNPVSLEEDKADSDFHEENTEKDIVENVYEFQGICPSCRSSCPTKMHPIDIPYFKEVIIMATTCSFCNFRSTEVKTGGAISSHGKRIILSLETMEDLSRDVLKSETCSLSIPELDLELGPGTLGGKFTTIEGMLTQINEEMKEQIPFALGDSATPAQTEKFQEICSTLTEIANGRKKVTIIIDDPLSNSYLQSFFAPDPDPQISIVDYERTLEQQDTLGLSHLDV